MTATPPAASVIVPTYRGAERLPRLLDALAAQQTGTPPFEVLVVVDGEAPSTLAVLAAEDRLSLRVEVHAENRGRVAALNTGFAAALGEVLIRCDDDLLPAPGFVVAHVSAHAAASDDEPLAVVGPCPDVHSPSAYARAYGSQAARRAQVAARDLPSAQRWRLWAANCSLTRETWQRIGTYDTDYRRYGWEDVDYGWRIRTAGIEVLLLPEAAAGHLGAPTTATGRARRAFHSGAARRTFERKHPQAPLPPAIPPWSPWNTAVRAVSRLPLPVTAQGRAVDALLPLLPSPVGRKLVAVLVEGAGLAGYRRPRIAQEVF